MLDLRAGGGGFGAAEEGAKGQEGEPLGEEAVNGPREDGRGPKRIRKETPTEALSRVGGSVHAYRLAQESA